MAWLAVGKNGEEIIFTNKPKYILGEWSDEIEICVESEYGVYYNEVELPKGTIQKLIGKELTFEESPIEIK